MWSNLTGWHALIIMGIIVLLFGATKLPGLAKSVGQSIRLLKSESHDDTAEGTTSSSDTNLTGSNNN